MRLAHGGTPHYSGGVKPADSAVKSGAAKACEPRVRRNVGLLVLKVVEAEGLKKMDTFGKADPFVEAYTQAHQTERTVRGRSCMHI